MRGEYEWEFMTIAVQFLEPVKGDTLCAHVVEFYSWQLAHYATSSSVNVALHGSYPLEGNGGGVEGMVTCGAMVTICLEI
jgi:hypothetical protein